MATNKPVGDNPRKGAVKKRSQLATKTMGKKMFTKRSKGRRSVHGAEEEGQVQRRAQREVSRLRADLPMRTATSAEDLVGVLSELHSKHVGLYLHQQGIDTTTPSGKALCQMMGVFSEFERAMIRERVLSGLARARSEGTKLGAPPLTPPKLKPSRPHARPARACERSQRSSVSASAQSNGWEAKPWPSNIGRPAVLRRPACARGEHARRCRGDRLLHLRDDVEALDHLRDDLLRALDRLPVALSVLARGGGRDPVLRPRLLKRLHWPPPLVSISNSPQHLDRWFGGLESARRRYMLRAAREAWCTGRENYIKSVERARPRPGSEAFCSRKRPPLSLP